MSPISIETEDTQALFDDSLITLPKKDVSILKNKEDSMSELQFFSQNEIKSYCFDKDYNQLFIITGSKKKDFGNSLKIYFIRNNKIVFKKKMLDKGQNPWKVLIGNLDSDGIVDVVVGVWKKVLYEKKYRNRLFIYDWDGKEIRAKWLSSRLSSHFFDFKICDIDSNGIDEIITLELQRNGMKKVNSYRLSNFGLLPYKILKINLNILSLDNFNY